MSFPATVLDVPTGLLAIAMVAVVLGSMVQSTLGIGLGMLAGPLLTLADRAFVPGAILIVILPMTFAIAARERSGIDYRGVGIALVGRLPGVMLGAWAIAIASERFLVVLVGSTVLLSVALSMTRIRFTTATGTLFTAGLVSGFMGTSTGVGGPPMAMTYQHADPAVMRSTVSAFFLFGAVMSIIGLTVSGAIGTRQLQLGALLLPAVALGFGLAQIFARRIQPQAIRPAVLIVCSISSVALLLDEFI
jgi:uncharacterized protein